MKRTAIRTLSSKQQHLLTLTGLLALPATIITPRLAYAAPASHHYDTPQSATDNYNNRRNGGDHDSERSTNTDSRPASDSRPSSDSHAADNRPSGGHNGSSRTGADTRPGSDNRPTDNRQGNDRHGNNRPNGDTRPSGDWHNNYNRPGNDNRPDGNRPDTRPGGNWNNGDNRQHDNRPGNNWPSRPTNPGANDHRPGTGYDRHDYSDHRSGDQYDRDRYNRDHADRGHYDGNRFDRGRTYHNYAPDHFYFSYRYRDGRNFYYHGHDGYWVDIRPDIDEYAWLYRDYGGDGRVVPTTFSGVITDSEDGDPPHTVRVCRDDGRDFIVFLRDDVDFDSGTPVHVEGDRAGWAVVNADIWRR